MNLSDNILFSGILTNCSKHGIFIRTHELSLFDSNVEIIISMGMDLLKVPARVVRVVLTGNSCEGIGLKLIHMPKKYLKFLIKLNLNP
jgi:Tfp pilus assembly protein PilZ